MVQPSPSSQLLVLLVLMHPAAASQASSVHTLPSSQFCSKALPLHCPDRQVSRRH
jgi:hypothetical protein